MPTDASLVAHNARNNNKNTKNKAMRGKIIATARAAMEITTTIPTTTKLDKVEQTSVNNKTN